MRLARIFVHPVKSLRGAESSRARVERQGLADDRRWMIVDETGRFVTIRQHAALLGVEAQATAEGLTLADRRGAWRAEVARPGADAPRVEVGIWRDRVPALLVEGAGSARLSALLGTPVRLAFLDDTGARAVSPAYSEPSDRVSFADAFPLLLISTSSLADLSARIGVELDARRFRPNVVVDGAPPWAEDTWRRVTIGGVPFRVAKPCGRCTVPGRDPDTGDALPGNEPLATLARFHRDTEGEIIFGQNLIPDGEGEVAVGDGVEAIEIGPSNVTGRG